MCKKADHFIGSFLSDEDAQALAEYALLAFVLVLASYGALKLFTGAWRIKFETIKEMRSGLKGIGP
ncbi:MAG: Flp family type IVb pilin [Endomicrobiales bacterium]